MNNPVGVEGSTEVSAGAGAGEAISRVAAATGVKKMRLERIIVLTGMEVYMALERVVRNESDNLSYLYTSLTCPRIVSVSFSACWISRRAVQNKTR